VIPFFVKVLSSANFPEKDNKRGVGNPGKYSHGRLSASPTMVVLAGTLSLRTHEQNNPTTLRYSTAMVYALVIMYNERTTSTTSAFFSGSRPHSSEGKTDGCLEMSAFSKAMVPKDGRTNCLWYSFAPASSIAAISASVSLGASNVLRYSTRRDSFVVVLELIVSR
jgi:hypothetical protein